MVSLMASRRSLRQNSFISVLYDLMLESRLFFMYDMYLRRNIHKLFIFHLSLELYVFL
jgi:hypothetical protein